MMISPLRAATIGLLLAGAAPLFAQSAPAPAPAPAAPETLRAERMAKRAELRAQMQMDHAGQRGGMFAGLSEAGRATMREAMQSGGDRRADREAVKAARDRMLTVLDADRLDMGALKRAMDEERKAAQASHDRRQASMLAGFEKLSVADRKAFVASARDMRARMDERVGKMREWAQRRRAMRADVPPPPPPTSTPTPML